MNKALYATAGILLALSLAGCSAAIGTPQAAIAPTGDDPTAVESATPEPSAEASLVPQPADWTYTVEENGEQILLGALRNEGLFGMDDATDDELLTFGYAACEQLAAGIPIDAVDVIPTDYPEENVPGWNDRSMAGLASETLCTEFNMNDNR